ncbi:MAG: AraC family transcriptional regulator ligand-binding domain-containing protein [Bacteroidota bacterium]
MPQTYRVPAELRLLFDDLGVSVENVLRRAGLPADLLRREVPEVTTSGFVRFWTALGDETEGRPVGLAIGRIGAHEVFSPPIVAVLASPNLATAARRIAQFKALIGPLTLRVEDTAAGLKLTKQGKGFKLPPVLSLMEASFWTHLARRVTRAPITPIRITLPERPPDTATVEDTLGCRIRTGPETSVTFSAADAQRPFLTADAEAWRFYKPVLERQLAEMEQSATLAERVHAVLVEMLPSGRGRVEDVADALALSPRSLQRHLRREGTTFQKTLAATREQLATHYLRVPEMETTEVAFLLGYDDPNSFFRAFRAWTGTTPERARLALEAA